MTAITQFLTIFQRLKACVKTSMRLVKVHQQILHKTLTATRSMNKVLKHLTAMKFRQKEAAIVQNPKKIVMMS